jgi:glycosyltransferase involved in cell wall biosynthesis
MNKKKFTISVLIPCYNEGKTIARVIDDFKRYLPEAIVYVYDNNSSDDTVEKATKAGAIVRFVKEQGKGSVVREMFREVDSDFYILIDGDSTYPVQQVHALLSPAISGEADMVVGDRISGGHYGRENKRPLHFFGNTLVRTLINRLFHSSMHDIMSGYRVFSKLFVKTMPVLSSGFEIETEMTLHALDKRVKCVEVPIEYKDRPEGSHSKLSTVKDGLSVLITIFVIFKNYKPFLAFTLISVCISILGLFIGIPPILEYYRYAYVYKVPSAVLAASMEILSMLFFSCGLILDTIVKHNKEQHEIKVLDFLYKKSSL